jgi:4-hydroxyphenylpyruvate dioxygenase-like putative hemolysin
MSHHASEPMDEFLREQMDAKAEALGDKFNQQMEIEAQRMGLGATGRHPSGSIHVSDEGEIRLGVASDEKAGKVMLNFGKPVAWLAFNPEEAVQVAQALIQHARKVAKEPIAIRLN